MSTWNLMPELLRENHIFFYEDAQEVEQPPPQVAALRDALLDFDCTIADQFALRHDDDINTLDWEHAFRLRRAKKAECDSVRAKLTKYRRTKQKAWLLHDGGDQDTEWKKYYYEHFFEPLMEEAAINEGDNRRTSRMKTYYDSLEWASGKPWTLFEKDADIRLQKKELPAPTPDCVAYLPVYGLEDKGKQRVDRWQWPSSPKGAAANFSRKVLEHLTHHGLQPSTAGVFDKGWQTELSRADYQCFPWLIVEHKEDVLRDKESRCYCRAANAADATLIMNQLLATYAENKTDDVHIPPVVTMTTVGKDIKIWIAYACNKGEDHRMVCVWNGDATVAMDIIKLEAILENLHTWVMRELRPLISSYISQWLFRFPTNYQKSLKKAPSEVQNEETALVRVESHSSHHSDAAERLEVTKTELRDLIQEEHEYLIWKMEKLVKSLAKADHAKAEKPKVEKPKSPKHRRKRRESSLASVSSVTGTR